MSRRSRVTRVTGQLTDGSRGSQVKKCDPLSSVVGVCQSMTFISSAFSRRRSAVDDTTAARYASVLTTSFITIIMTTAG